MGINNENGIVLEEDYAFVWVELENFVYIIRNNEVHTEVIFKDLSLTDAVQLKKDGVLFVTHDEAVKSLLTENNIVTYTPMGG